MRDSAHLADVQKKAYWRRCCILSVDGFYEWKAIKGQKAKQPYAIAPTRAVRPAAPLAVKYVFPARHECAAR
jgi:putative SOS response-associated peptidase YedK